MSRIVPVLTFACGLALGGALTASALPATSATETGRHVASTAPRTASADNASTPTLSVTGLGGVFLKADDPAALAAWYADHLGMEVGPNGANFLWQERGEDGRPGRTVWSLFPAGSDYFGAAGQQCMLNYRVADLDALLERLEAAGVEQVKPMESYAFGSFAWVEDAEGNRVELWEPPAEGPGAP